MIRPRPETGCAEAQDQRLLGLGDREQRAAADDQQQDDGDEAEDDVR